MSDTDVPPGRYYTLPGLAQTYGLAYLDSQRIVIAGAIPGAVKGAAGRWLIPVAEADDYFAAGPGAERLDRRRPSPPVVEVAEALASERAAALEDTRLALRALTAGDSPPAASSEQEREAGDSAAPTPLPARSSGLSAPLVAWLLVVGLAVVVVVLVLVLALA